MKGYVLSLWYTTILWQILLTWLTASDEVRVLLFDIHLTSSEYGFKHTFSQMKKFVCFVWLTVYPYWTGTGIMARKGRWNNFLQLDMQVIVNQRRIRTWFRPTEVFRVLTVSIQPICSVYELDTRLALSNEIRIYAKVTEFHSYSSKVS